MVVPSLILAVAIRALTGSRPSWACSQGSAVADPPAAALCRRYFLAWCQ